MTRLDSDRRVRAGAVGAWPWAGGVRWWSGSESGRQVRLFRLQVEEPGAIRSAQLHLFAEMRCHVWCNGQYLGRGPIHHHPHRRPVMRFDLTGGWRVGRNVVAVLVWTESFSLHNGQRGAGPGLTARIEVCDGDGTRREPACEGWRCWDRTGWSSQTPRRNWALGAIECLDAAHHPLGWQAVEFDDTAWPRAREYRLDDPRGAAWIDPGLPPLCCQEHDLLVRLGTYHTSATVAALHREDSPAAFGAALMDEPWSPARLSLVQEDNTLCFSDLDPRRGVAVTLDLGRLRVGQLLFECESSSPGVIDIGWSERMRGDRPWMMLKNTSYADRLVCGRGVQCWEPMQYSSARYVALILRGFAGGVTIRRLRFRASEAALRFDASRWSGEKNGRLAALAERCVRTLRAGTQEGLVDCPSREQAPYLGDGHLAGRWLLQLTGDASHWRYLLTEAMEAQDRQGLLPDALFSGQQRSLMDYTLLTIVGARDYLRMTGDRETVTRLLPGCRRAACYFLNRINAQGLCVTPPFHPARAQSWQRDPARTDYEPMLFIDHPGLGWHNRAEPGLDRRGVNAALNALVVVALRSLAEMERTVGQAREAGRWSDHAAALKQRLKPAFWNPDARRFADGWHEGAPLASASEQTQIAMIWAGAADDGDAIELLRAMRQVDRRTTAIAGPYFLSYAIPLMRRLGLEAEACELVLERFGPMIDDAQVDTLWETFAGDELDSMCHPWSASPLLLWLDAPPALEG